MSTGQLRALRATLIAALAQVDALLGQDFGRPQAPAAAPVPDPNLPCQHPAKSRLSAASMEEPLRWICNECDFTGGLKETA